jgi:hypothetical protein
MENLGTEMSPARVHYLELDVLEEPQSSGMINTEPMPSVT